MHRLDYKIAPSIFLTKFHKPSHVYPTNFPSHNYLVPTLKLKKSKGRVSIRGLLLWNILTAGEKTQKKSSKIPHYYKGKTSFNDKWNKLFLYRNIKTKNHFLLETNYSNSNILHSGWRDLMRRPQWSSASFFPLFKTYQKIFFFLFSSSTQYYFMTVFIFYIVIGCHITTTM